MSRPELPPPPLPRRSMIMYIDQRQRRAHWDGLDRKVMPRVTHCVKIGFSAALCGVDPSMIRPYLRKRATTWEPEIWSKKKTWIPVSPDRHEITCATCRAVIRKAVDKLHRPQIRYRAHGIKERNTKPRNELSYAKKDEWYADREPWLGVDATAKPKEKTMNFMSLPKRGPPKPAAEIPAAPPTPAVQPTLIPVKAMTDSRSPGRTARLGTPPMGTPTPVPRPVPLKRTAPEMTK